jgi:hypothetical protein
MVLMLDIYSQQNNQLQQIQENRRDFSLKGCSYCLTVTTGVTSGAGTTYPSVAPESPLIFIWVRVAQIFIYNKYKKAGDLDIVDKIKSRGLIPGKWRS